MTFRDHPELVDDLLSRAIYYSDYSEAAADSFPQHYEEIVARIRSNPEMFGRIEAEVRAVRVRPYRDVVYYTLHRDVWYTLAVLPGGVDDRRWRERLANL